MRACSLPRTSCLFVGDSRHRLLLPVWCVPGDHPANAAPGSGISPSRRGFTWTWVWATAWPAARRSLRPIVNPSGPRPARSRRRTSPTNFQTAAARRWATRRCCSRVSGHHEGVPATDRVGARHGDCRHCSWVRARQYAEESGRGTPRAYATPFRRLSSAVRPERLHVSREVLEGGRVFGGE